jgi:DNA-binding NarL/FixJ family response regulator
VPISIAIVDDSPQVRQALRSFLETNTNWEICGEAENGQAAIELVQRLKPDLLILDLSMPVMNGFDAARKIIADDPKTGIVMFTAHAAGRLLEEANQIGIKAVVQKDGNASLLLLLTKLRELSSARRVA